MNGRQVASWLAWPLLAIAVGGLLFNEARFEPGEPASRAEQAGVSAIEQVRFLRDQRPANFARVGLKGADLDRAIEHAARLDRARDDLAAGLAQIDADEVQTFLCNGGRAMYDASAVVLSGSGVKLEVVAPSPRAPWVRWSEYDAARVRRLMDHWEGRSVRVPEDTAMALTALLSGHLADALPSGGPPWNQRAGEGGLLRTLQELEPRAATLLPVYAATVHVLVEIVESDPQRWQCNRGAR